MATDKPGAPNENIVQNHLNIVKRILMFKQLDIGIFYPLKIFHLLGFPSWKSSDPKTIGIKTYLFWKFEPGKRCPKILGDLFTLKFR